MAAQYSTTKQVTLAALIACAPVPRCAEEIATAFRLDLILTKDALCELQRLGFLRSDDDGWSYTITWDAEVGCKDPGLVTLLAEYGL